MRFLRIPIISEVAEKLPDWVIRELERPRDEERREAPRLERPDVEPLPREPQKPEPDGGTVIIIEF